MADNFATDLGSGGPIFAADDIGGILWPRTKLGIGADGAAVDLAFGQQVAASSLPVVIASDQSAVAISDGGGVITVDGTVSAAQSGAWSISISGALPAGTNNIGDVDIASMPTGGSAAQVQGTVAADAPVANNPVLIGGRASDAVPTAVSADGDAVFAWQDRRGAIHSRLVDASGDDCTDAANDAVRVSIVAGGGSGGTSMVDDAVFTPATTSFTPIGAFADETTPDLVDEGDGGALRMTLARGLHTNIRDDAGDSCMDGTNNALRVNIVAGGGAGGTSITDDSAFTPGTTAVTPAGGIYRSVRDLVDDNDAGALAMTQRRALYVALETPDGDSMANETVNALNVNVSHVAGSAAVAPTFGAGNADAGTQRVVVASDQATLNVTALGAAAHDAVVSGNPLLLAAYGSTATPAAVSADGDVVRLWADLNGRLQIGDGGGSLTVDVGAALPSGTNNIGDVDVLSIVPGTGATNLGKAEDAVHASGDIGVMALAVRSDTQGAVSGASGDYNPLQVNAQGALLVSQVPDTKNGCSVFRSLDLDETEEEVKGSAGIIYSIWVTNRTAATRWLKIYNAPAASVTVGTTTPIITIGIPGNTSDNITGQLSAGGQPIDIGGTGICVAATTGFADADTGAPGANDLIINVFYK